MLFREILETHKPKHGQDVLRKMVEVSLQIIENHKSGTNTFQKLWDGHRVSSIYLFILESPLNIPTPTPAPNYTLGALEGLCRGSIEEIRHRVCRGLTVHF